MNKGYSGDSEVLDLQHSDPQRSLTYHVIKKIITSLFRMTVTANALDNIIDTVAPKQATDERVPLPVERAIHNAPGQGWLVPTTVKNSNIPEAGNGRYVMLTEGGARTAKNSHTS